MFRNNMRRQTLQEISESIWGFTLNLNSGYYHDNGIQDTDAMHLDDIVIACKEVTNKATEIYKLINDKE